jgi:hypothetical protein
MNKLADLLAAEGLAMKTAQLDPEEVDLVIDMITDATDRNDHNGALELLCNLLNAHKTKRLLTHIQGIHSLLGHMPHGLVQVRTEYVYKPLMAEAKRKLDPEQFQSLHAAF